ncbi:Dcc1p [Rhodotorula paludigena]|uniref:Dcc1p n=1 Tax=Rhodotorula paludigena TaxID=86838 RepID=UPI0031712E6D
MHERLVQFTDKAQDPAGTRTTSYQLLALPPALAALLSTAPSSSSSALEIRGDLADSAVLVTDWQTYALRGVQNSNSLCVCASGSGDDEGRQKWFVSGTGGSVGASAEPAIDDADDGPARKKTKYAPIEIEAVLHETLEAVPAVARTDKLEALLKGAEYAGDAAEEDAATQATRQHVTFDSLRSRIPASDAEIRTALKRNRVVELDGYLRPLPSSFLLSILPSVLSTLPVPAAIAHTAAPTGKKDKGKGKAVPAAASSGPVWTEAEDDDLVDALDAVDCGSEQVARALLGWFGEELEVAGKRRWKLDARQVVKEVGIVSLANGGFGRQPLDPFVTKWKSVAGGFAPLCELSLLAGLHICEPPPLSTIQYLPPSSLSPDPAARFAELFSLKSRWLEADMSLFIDDLTGGDKKKRDALVLKFVRKVRERETTWWTPRNLWT